MLVRCACGWEKTVKDELRGKTAKCPKCGAMFELQPAPELVAAAPIAAAHAAPVIAQPPESVATLIESDSEEWMPAEASDEEDPFAEIPAPLPHQGPPKISPWKTPNLKAFRGRLQGHFPNVALAAWILHVYSRICWIVFAVIVLISIAFLGLGVVGFVMGLAAGSKGGGLMLALIGLGASMVWTLSMLGIAVSLAVAAAMSAAAAELGVSWAASFVGQQISPCGGMRRAE